VTDRCGCGGNKHGMRKGLAVAGARSAINIVTTNYPVQSYVH
jgi:hypothetical protein